MISIVCIETETSGNIGAIARVMKNFDLNKLVLINPKCDHLSKEAMDRATHAKEILRKAKVEKDFSVLSKFDYVIATTAKLGTDYNIPRVPISPSDLGENINFKKKVALVIGREGNGLTNDEILKCDFVVTIPSSKKYATLNISHACAILFYELFRASGKTTVSEHIPTASKRDKDQIMKILEQVLDKMQFATVEKKETQRRIWKRLVGKSFLSKREAMALMGFLKKIK